MTYDSLLIEADNEGLIVREKSLKGSCGRIFGKRIAIKKDIPIIEKGCALAEELGHHHTTYGNILDQRETGNIKQEYKARVWAYNRMIGLSGLVNAYKQGCQNTHETAEFLNVTEEFLKESIECYRKKFGLCTVIDNYLVYFEPGLGVFEMTEFAP